VTQRGMKSKPPVSARLLIKAGIVRTTKQANIFLCVVTVIIVLVAFYFFAIGQEQQAESFEEQLKGGATLPHYHEVV